MLYSGFMPAKKREERLKMKMSELVESVSKKPVPAVSVLGAATQRQHALIHLAQHAKYLIFEVMCDDVDGEDVEVPYVRVEVKP